MVGWLLNYSTVVQLIMIGEMELQRKEEEIRLTKIEMHDLENSIRITKEKIKEIPG